MPLRVSRHRRLTIGVALSAGGASAMAQAGVLEQLADAGVQVDCVAGTSAGAVVGAAYAADRLPEFSQAMCALTRRRVLRLFDPKWPRTGLLEGRHGMELIQPYIGDRIEGLPRRYAAVATDLASGTTVVLRSGATAEAIRASIAIPGIFTPRWVEGRLLVDGGLVDPIPTAAVRELGADFTIAVSVLPPPGTARKRRVDGRAALRSERGEMSMIEIILRAGRVVESQIAASRLREQPPDFLIHVPLPEIGLFELDRSQEMMRAGRQAALRAWPELRTALEARASVARRVRSWFGAGAKRPRAPSLKR